MFFRRKKTVLAAAVAFLCLAVGGARVLWASPAIANGGFEDDIGGSTYGNWDNTNGAVRVSSATVVGLGFSAVPAGGFALRIPAGTFTFQLTDNIHEGDFVSFSALAESSILAASGGRMTLEWKRLNEDGTDETFETITSARINTGNAPALGGYVRFTISGVAPKGARRAAFVLDANGAGSTIFDSVVAAVNPAELTVTLSKHRAVPGDVVALLASFINQTGDALSNVSYAITVPAGLTVMPEGVILDGNKVPLTSSGFVNVGTVAAGRTVRLSSQILVSQGAQPGKDYEIDFKIFNGSNLSGNRRVRIIVEEDPLFSQGTIIGKVFQDSNKNGVQDKGEQGVPWVRLATEDGVVVVTDEHGRYSIPAVRAGRHVVKIDGHTLPEGTEFVTEEAYLIHTTEGILNKANFAVFMPPSKIPQEFQKDLSVRVTQGLDTSRPKLDVLMDPEILKTGLGVLEREALFKLENNYPDFLKRWLLEIRDEMGREVWIGFGVGVPPAEVRWAGQTESGLLIKPGMYSYQLKVEDKSGRQDWSPLHFFRVISKNTPDHLAHAPVSFPAVGDFNLFKDGKSSIPMVAKPTIRVQGKTKPNYKVLVNQYPVPVDTRSGNFQTEVYASPGEKEILVQATSPEGETTSYHETVKVKDSTFFMVALSEGEGGVHFTDGNIQTPGEDKQYKRGIYTDGRVSYYLKGKIKGRFLVKSHYDTDDKRSALFKNLNEKDYYPVYGDDSTRDYETQNTTGRLYLVIEMDRSFIRYGSFQTDFTDTELATYNRSLSGLKGHFETTKTTAYGDAVRGVTVFSSKSANRADHNEFMATGGTLYYLRNRRVVQGSEKIRVEVRDKIQDIAVSSRDLVAGVDYDIDTQDGRILLTKPLSSVASSDTLTSLDILDGNPVYLIVDYEFETDPDTLENRNNGIRGFTHMGDHVRVGATYVEELRGAQRYDLRGIDGQLKIGRNTRLFTEYAESYGGQQTENSISYNGGLSFGDQSSLRGQATRPREGAYMVKGESKPIKNLELAGFLQGVEGGFSNDHIRSQEGFKKYGVSALYKLSDYARVRYRYDQNAVADKLLPFVDNHVVGPYEDYGAHTAQALYDDGRWLAQAEYQRHRADIPTSNVIPTLISEVQNDNAIVGKFGYHINDKLLTYVKAQTTINGKSNNQFGGGLRYEMMQGFYGYVEEMIGNLGDSTYLGFEKSHRNGARSYASVRQSNRNIGNEPVSTVIGSSAPVFQRSRVYNERDFSTYSGQEGYADSTGLEGVLGELGHFNYDLKFERRQLKEATTRAIDVAAQNSQVRPNSITTTAGSLSYSDHDKLKAGTRLEVRRDSDVLKLWQWVSRNFVEYKFTPSLTVSSRLDYGKTIFSNPHDIPADFTEFTSGFAYRPVDHDKLNILSRYTYTRDLANDLQFASDLYTGLQTKERAHIIAIDIAYDLFKHLGLVQKLAAKRGIFSTSESGPLAMTYFLFAERFNVHVTRKWDVALEYRGLFQWGGSEAMKHGALIEVNREFYEYVRLGAGYNFTDFDDDLRKTNNYNSHGPFVRLTGKF